MLGLTKTAAWEYGSSNVRINAVGPAFIKTAMIEVLDEEALNTQLIPRHALGRLGTPDEVSELVLWLSSDRASFATGGLMRISYCLQMASDRL